MLPQSISTPNPPANRLRILAVGTIGPGQRELRAPARFAPAAEEVEHRIVAWRGDWLAEVRVNLRLLHRAVFRGATACADALAWCAAVAPQADGRGVRVRQGSELAALIVRNDELRAGVEAERVALAARFEDGPPWK